MGLGLPDDRAQEIFLGQEQLRFPIAVHVGGAQPRLFGAAAGRRDVLFIKRLVAHLQQHFDFLIRRQDNEVVQPVLVHIVEGQRRRI